MTIEIGQDAPGFSLPDQEERVHTLSDYKGKWVLLYFYPKDNTPGCTKEACSIRDNFPDFSDLEAVVLGVSSDSTNSHKKFAEKYRLPFVLLSDKTREVIDVYGALAEKNILGKIVKITLRTSFLIDPTGKIAKIYKKVNPQNHAEEVVKDLKNMQIPKQ